MIDGEKEKWHDAVTRYIQIDQDQHHYSPLLATMIKITSLFLLFLGSATAFAPASGKFSSSTSLLLSGESQNNDASLPDRRSAMATAAGVVTGGILTSVTSSPAEAQSMPLFVKVKQLETANYMGRIGQPIYPPNSNGAPEKHIPQVSIDGNNLEITAKHIMSEEHFIQFMWLKDAKTEEVVLAKELAPTEDSPVLKARVPSGVTLRPYLFCNLHGLWKGEEFTVA